MESSKHISRKLNNLFNSIPEELQSKLKIQKHIQKSNEQFSKVVEQGILNHVNSVYVLPDDGNQQLSKEELAEYRKQNANKKKIVVYIDNSICAAELNARRELIVLKYRELFGLHVTSFEIKISKSKYKNQYPFIQKEEEISEEEYELTVQDYLKIDELVSEIEQPRLKESFKNLLIAQKRKYGLKSKK